MTKKHWLWVILLVAVAAAIICAHTLRRRPGPESPATAPALRRRPGPEPPATAPALRQRSQEPALVMGTTCRLIAVAPAGDRELGRALRAAESELRRVEALMSTRLANSALARLNAAPPGRPVPIPRELAGLLARSRELAGETRGAFDVTCRPILRVWKSGAQAGQAPSAEAMTEALARTGWEHFELSDAGVTKDIAAAEIDLGGIAKGYGIDRAAAALRRAGATGGLVDVGGDVYCFGRPAAGGSWRVGVQDPFSDELALVLSPVDKAVATSGDYERFSIIDGKRYSHIVNPRTGRPVEGASSVTVIADDATTADAWATALSVLGPDGLDLAAARGMEALMILGGPENYRIFYTPGFRDHVAEGWPVRLGGGGTQP